MKEQPFEFSRKYLRFEELAVLARAIIISLNFPFNPLFPSSIAVIFPSLSVETPYQ
jgi:hypothetical protein